MKKYLIAIILISILTLTFFTNFLSRDNIGVSDFEHFQSDSEKLALNKIYSDRWDVEFVDNCKYGLCINENAATNNVFDESNSTNIIFDNYTSQIGLQGYIESFLYNKLKIHYNVLKFILCTLLSIVLYLICYNVTKKYNKVFGTVFYVTFLLSPWVTAFAKNLYWVEFTWFLPMMFSLMLVNNYKQKKIFLPLIFLSILIKCACGYEFISVIMLSAVIFPIIDFISIRKKEDRKKVLSGIFEIGVVCLLAFSIVLIIHGYIRGNGNVLTGIKDIYHRDVLRRTILTYEKNLYDGAYRESMDASVLKVMDKYIYSWTTEDIIIGINSKYFPLLMFCSLVFSLILIYKKQKDAIKNFSMLIAMFIMCISWFILGKSHSYIHTHINFVLWYFGYIQICIYICIVFFVSKIKELKK